MPGRGVGGEEAESHGVGLEAGRVLAYGRNRRAGGKIVTQEVGRAEIGGGLVLLEGFGSVLKVVGIGGIFCKLSL